MLDSISYQIVKAKCISCPTINLNHHANWVIIVYLYVLGDNKPSLFSTTEA